MQKSESRWTEILAWVIDRLHHADIDLPDVARRAGVGYPWLYRLRQGRYREPGWAKLGRVYEVLGGKPPRMPLNGGR